MRTVEIMLVDDHAIVRAGYRALLSKQNCFQIVAEADSGEKAYTLYQKLLPDIVLLDLSLPGKGGIATLLQIRQFDPKANVLIFSMHQNPAMVKKTIEAGARGYVTKSSDPESLIQAIKTVARGKIALSDDIASALAIQNIKGERSIFADLTTREFEVLRMLAEGKTKQEIAEILCITIKTASNCHYLIKSKLDVKTDIELIHLALQSGLITSIDIQ